MLTVTDGARGHLSQMLHGRPKGAAIRLLIDPETGGMKAKLDNPRAGDTTIEQGGRTVLILDEDASRSLADSTLDVTDKGDGPTLILNSRTPDA